MVVRTMHFQEITPHVRHITTIQCYPGPVTGPRMLYDHQFVYIHQGRGAFTIGGIEYSAMPGDLFYYQPAEIHSITADPTNPFLICGISFDFTDNYRHLQFPIGPFGTDVFEHDKITEHVRFTDFVGFSNHCNLAGDHRISELCHEMVEEYEGGRRFSVSQVNGLFAQWLTSVARYVTATAHGLTDARALITEEIVHYMRDHYNDNLTSGVLGSVFHFHPHYLNKLVTAYTGSSPHQYLISLRVKKAIYLIANSNLSITQIAREVGYDDLHYFSRLIKDKTGFSPKQLKSMLCGAKQAENVNW